MLSKRCWLLGFPVFLLIACAELEVDNPTPEIDLDPQTPSDFIGTDDGKFDLPNDSLINRDHDGRGYREIAEYFGYHGYELEPDLSRLEPDWPMAGEHTALLNRFGTPIQAADYAYFHTAFDVYRFDPESDSDQVLAPFAGMAFVFDWWGIPGHPNQDYATVVAIWDPESHVVAQLMHVRPSQRLMDAGTEFIQVERGEIIGTLANDLTWLEEEHQGRLRHTHVDLIDGINLTILNPASYFEYRDSVPPTINELYVLDQHAERHTTLVSGRLDVVLDTHDRDEDSNRNFEVGSIAYEIVDQAGNVLSQSARCFFENLFESIENPYTPQPLNLIDFGNARHQLERGDWPSTDVDDRERSFRYALTQFYVNEAGRCDVHSDVYSDPYGFVEISDAVTAIEVRAQVWDHNENVTEFVQTIQRDPSGN